MADLELTDPLLRALRRARPVTDLTRFAPTAEESRAQLTRILALDRHRPPREPEPASARGPARRTRARLVAALAVAALAAALVPLALGSPATRAGAGRAFVLVDDRSPFPFQPVGAVAGQPDYTIDCAGTTCYAQEAMATGHIALERSTDAGASWQAAAGLSDGDWLLPLADGACASALVCAGAAVAADGADQSRIAVTSNGGESWRELSGPDAAFANEVACVDTLHCVVYANTPGAFFVTANGGASWTRVAPPPPAVDDALGGLEGLHCAADGSCVALSGTPPALVVLRSDDGGASWTFSAPAALPPESAGPYYLSCGDGLHCLFAYPSAGAYQLASTSDGGASWHANALPAPWPPLVTALSCGADGSCFVAAAQPTPGGGYEDPVIEGSDDGGTSWTSYPLPATANGSPLADVVTMSCPSGAGCVAFARTDAGFVPPSGGAGAPLGGSLASWVVLSNLRAGS